MKMTPSKKEVRSSYQSGAKYYNFAVRLYALIGIRKAYRSRTVERLHLKRGDRVVELGCGTGLNFPLIMERIGPEGRLTGVDISPNMLARAREMVDRYGWKNVELIESNIEAYEFPEKTDAVLSVGVFGYLTDYDRVIEAISNALVPDGRLAILDGKRPDRLPSWIFKFIVWVSRVFGVTSDYFDKHTWDSAEREFQEITFEQMYGGMVYILSARKPLLKT